MILIVFDHHKDAIFGIHFVSQSINGNERFGIVVILCIWTGFFHPATSKHLPQSESNNLWVGRSGLLGHGRIFLRSRVLLDILLRLARIEKSAIPVNILGSDTVAGVWPKVEGSPISMSLKSSSISRPLSTR